MIQPHEIQDVEIRKWYKEKKFREEKAEIFQAKKTQPTWEIPPPSILQLEFNERYKNYSIFQKLC